PLTSVNAAYFFFSSRRRHTRSLRDWSSDVCSSDLTALAKVMCLDAALRAAHRERRLGDVHALERPQQKRLALPARQAPERALERRHRLLQLETPRRLRVGARSLG